MSTLSDFFALLVRRDVTTLQTIFNRKIIAQQSLATLRKWSQVEVYFERAYPTIICFS